MHLHACVQRLHSKGMSASACSCLTAGVRAGCKMCAGLHVNKLGLCDTIFLRSYVEAFQTLLAAAKDKSL